VVWRVRGERSAKKKSPLKKKSEKSSPFGLRRRKHERNKKIREILEVVRLTNPIVGGKRAKEVTCERGNFWLKTGNICLEKRCQEKKVALVQPRIRGISRGKQEMAKMSRQSMGTCIPHAKGDGTT